MILNIVNKYFGEFFMTSKHSSKPNHSRHDRQRLVECYKRALHLRDHDRNYDYAHAMFAECVLHDPSNLMYVESLLENLRAKYPQSKTKYSALSSSRRPLTQAVRRNDWPNVLRLGIDLLKESPWDIATLRAVALACANLHYNEVELAYLKQALDANSKDIETNRHCAQSLARMGQFDQAIACWHRIEMIRPGNKEAIRMIGQLSEEKLKYPGGRPAPVSPAPQPAQSINIAIGGEKSDGEAEPILTPTQEIEQAIEAVSSPARNNTALPNVLPPSDRGLRTQESLMPSTTTSGVEAELNECSKHLYRVPLPTVSGGAITSLTENKHGNGQVRTGWLEAGFGLAILTLLLQLLPSLSLTIWNALDFRRWSQTTWIVASLMVIGALCLIHFIPSPSGPSYTRRKPIRHQ
jgi:tetratricopeptide (TPR) repeat protein